MPLIERLLHPMLAGDDGRPAFQSFGVACDSGLRLKTPPLKIVNQHRRRHRKPKTKPNRRSLRQSLRQNWPIAPGSGSVLVSVSKSE
ncbi:MAG: hypothetical protein WC340_11280 [Kiritimatiellia bacterium]